MHEHFFFKPNDCSSSKTLTFAAGPALQCRKALQPHPMPHRTWCVMSLNVNKIFKLEY